MKRMIVIEETESYRLSGKTGWSITDRVNNGWFVGFVEVKDNMYYFATNIEPHDTFDMSRFPKIRNEITLKALEHMGIVM